MNWAQKGQWDKIQAELYAEDAESIEPPNSPGLVSVNGLDAIKQKGSSLMKWWKKCMAAIPTEPIVAGNHFAVLMGMDVTMKGAGTL
jgi:hypothetical protein